MINLERHWLELFLGEITFRNALENDADASVSEFTSIVSRSTKHSAILSGLEGLLFYRLSRTIRDSRCDLSSMFEQVQLSQNLGEFIPLDYRKEGIGTNVSLPVISRSNLFGH
jgi:hypothetical protein